MLNIMVTLYKLAIRGDELRNQIFLELLTSEFISFTSKSFLFKRMGSILNWMGTILNIFFFLFHVSSYLYFTIIDTYNQ